MKIRKVLAAIPLTLFLLFIGADCQPTSPPVNPDANVSPDVPQDTEWCAAGCAALQHLIGRDGKPGCEESRSLGGPNGEIITCEQFCRDSQNAGRNLYPSCWVKAKTCSDIEQFRKRSTPCEGH